VIQGKNKKPRAFSRRLVLLEAFKYSVPVLLGYVTVGIAFGFMVSASGYPWWLAFLMSLWMFAGAGQFIALGLFSAGLNLWQVCLVQLVVNIRHVAYGLSMIKRFAGSGAFKPYLIFSLTDETFALHSSMPELVIPQNLPEDEKLEMREKRHLFMFFVAALNHLYWVAGSVIGALAGAINPFDIEGLSFALTALFVVLMIEQIKRTKKIGVFVVSGLVALLAVFLFPRMISLLAALTIALLLSVLVEQWGKVFANMRRKHDRH